jgi:hypothetical protein
MAAMLVGYPLAVILVVIDGGWPVWGYLLLLGVVFVLAPVYGLLEHWGEQRRSRRQG